jgi:hypothetical protein
MMNQESRSGGKGLNLETMNPAKFIASPAADFPEFLAS